MSHHSSIRLALTACVALLSACGKGSGEGEKAVAMRDMEVVDGTASDAMTDLDGVQMEGIALPPAAGATPAPAAATENSTAAAESKKDEDVVSDQ